MPYDPAIHHRRSIRLNGYDYTQAGAYFVTICVHEKARLFGTVRDGEVQLNDAGAMIEHWWSVLREKFPSMTTDAFVVMPNHVHGIIVINAGHNGGEHTGSPLRNAHNDVRADRRVRPDAHDAHNDVRADRRVRPDAPLGTIMQWFKTMTTNAYIHGVREQGWLQFDRRLWQRNYYEHVVRDGADLHRVRAYIVNNPRQWEQKRRQRYKHGGL